MQPPPAAALPDTLQARYPVVCPVCTHAFEIGPSLSMRGGINSGHASCSGCKGFFHVTLVDGAATLEPWGDFMARWTVEEDE